MLLSYQNKASLMASLHTAWVILGIVSLPLLFIITNYHFVTAVFLIVNVVAWVLWKGCPLRIWENEFRDKTVNAKSYDTTFTAYYLKKFFGITVSATATKTIIYAYLGLMLIITVYKFI